MKEIPTCLIQYIQGLKHHDLGKIAASVTEDVQFVSPQQTLCKSEFLEMLNCLYIAFPDWSYKHENPEFCNDGIAIRWTQCGTHTGVFNLNGMAPIKATSKAVTIGPHYFFYKVSSEGITQIRPDPVPGAAPGGILEQIGVSLPPI